ncbi:MAG: transposase [Actinomycetes bacterium]
MKPTSLLGKTTRRMAAEEIADLVAVDAKLNAVTKELKAARTRAARVLADVGDIARFPDRNHFASWTGTAPLDASSGEQIRHGTPGGPTANASWPSPRPRWRRRRRADRTDPRRR